MIYENICELSLCFSLLLLQDHIAYSYNTPAYIDSDSLSSSSQYQEYQDSPSPSSDRGGRKDRDSLPLAPLSGTTHQHICTPNMEVFSVVSKLLIHTHTHTYESLSPHIYIPFPLGRKEEGAFVPVPVRDAPDSIDAELHLVGPVLLRHVPVLLPKQGAPGAAVGPAQGQSQDHDLPEDGAGAEELQPHRRDQEGEAEAHLQVR